jgi:5-methyltetrahydropteroyltriglutamate--homocysteine methyltransferase
LIKTYALGIYPRSDKLIQATRKNDRKLPQLFKMEKKKLIKEQQKAKLSYVCDPLLDWNDMFRPFSTMKNISLGALNRFFETNTFYRKLIINGELDGSSSIVKSHLALSLLPKKKEIAACMPDPYTFADLNENKYYKNHTEYLFAVADMLKRETKALAGAKVKFIQLNAPSIAYNADNIDIGLVRDAVERVKNGVNAKVYLHLYFGNISKIFSKLLDIKVDGLSIDLSFTDLNSLIDHKVDRGLCLGVVNGMNTKMEDVKTTAKIVSNALDKMNPKEAYISTTCDLEFLPYEFAVKKLSRLGAIGRNVKYD